MRILLATNASYFPTRGGATRCNRAWLERMAEHGHECMVVSAGARGYNPEHRHRVRQELEAEGIADSVSGQSGVPFHWNRVELITPSAVGEMSTVLEESIKRTAPDFVLVSSEDFTQRLLRVALRIRPEATVYLAHTPQMFPFGPSSMLEFPPGAAAIKLSAEIVGISQFTRRYFEQFLGRTAHVVTPPLAMLPKPTNRSPKDRRFVTIVNPCAVKGLSIFLDVIREIEGVHSAALPGWGTTTKNMVELESAGVTILPPCRDMEEVWQRTRVLMVPSLWSEGFGMVVVEAMLRGIPVLSSDQGGLTEAKLGTDYIFPVNPIQRYEASFDECAMPVAEIPPQNVSPWRDAVKRLLTDELEYSRAAEQAQHAANNFISSIDNDALESLLLRRLTNNC